MIVLVHEDQAAPATRITSILEEQALTVTVCPLATPQAAFEAALADASILIVLLTPAVRDNQTLSGSVRVLMTP